MSLLQTHVREHALPGRHQSAAKTQHGHEPEVALRKSEQHMPTASTFRHQYLQDLLFGCPSPFDLILVMQWLNLDIEVFVISGNSKVAWFLIF